MKELNIHEIHKGMKIIEHALDHDFWTLTTKNILSDAWFKLSNDLQKKVML